MVLVIVLLLELVSQSRQADLTYVTVARCCGPRSTGARNCRLSMASEGAYGTAATVHSGALAADGVTVATRLVHLAWTSPAPIALLRF
jgi:hypothetical protein